MPDSGDERDLTTVLVTQHGYEAHIAAGRLEAAGIDCWVIDEAQHALHLWPASALGGVKLAVRAEQEARARQILAEEPVAPPEELELVDPAGTTSAELDEAETATGGPKVERDAVRVLLGLIVFGLAIGLILRLMES